MSTSRVINRWLNRVYKSIAILLVLFAVLISSLRLFLPYAHHYKENLQNLINTTNNSHIVIGNLSMGWEKLGPSLIIEQITLLETHSTDIFVDKIHVHLDFWQSLLKAQVITQDVTLDGVQIFIKNIDKSSAHTQKEDPLITRITDIFLDQISRFSLVNSQVVFQTNETEKLLLINQLDWLNNGTRHRGKGYVIVDGLTSNNIKVILDLHGDDIDELDGQIYLQANQLNITPWLDTVFAIDNENTHSAINFDGWLTVNNGFPTQLQVSLGNNEISWTHNNTPQFFSVNQGHIVANMGSNIGEFNLNHFNVFSSPLTFITNQHSWEPTHFQFSNVSPVFNGYVSYLDIAGITDIVPLFLNDQAITPLLDNINPEGGIKELFIQTAPNIQMVTAEIEKTKTYPYSGIPGISNLKGDIVVKNNAVKLMLSATEGELDFAEHFIQPIPYNNLSTDLHINIDNDAWSLSSEHIDFISDEITLNAEILVEKTKDSDTSMALLATVGKGDAEFADHYFPHLLMGEDLVNYLNASIVSGQVEQAQVLFNGPLNKFPFENNEGIFTVDAELSNAEFKFDPEWPAIKNFNANLNFTNNSMLITGRSGNLEGINVKGVTAAIKDLSNEQVLEVNAQVQHTKPQLVAALMNKSPLKSTVGNTLERLVIENPIAGDFYLNLPLNELDKVVAKGDVIFDNNRINLQAPDMLFTQVDGVLSYQNDRITANNVNLLWRDMPLTLTVKAQDKEMFYDTNIALDAKWESKQWLNQLPARLQEYGDGQLAWKGLISLNMYHEGGFRYGVDINSSLEGAELNLPAPYHKNTNESVVLKAHATGQNYSTTINASVGEQLQFYGELNHENTAFSKAHLMLGAEEMLLPTSGFHITAKLPQIDAKQWQPFLFNVIDTLNAQTPSENLTALVQPEAVQTELAQPETMQTETTQQSSSSPLFDIPERIKGEFDTLNYGDYTLTDTLLTVKNIDQAWLIDVNSKEVRSQLTLHDALYDKGIHIDADVIHLAKTTPNETEEKTVKQVITSVEQAEITALNKDIYTNLPPISLNCNQCIIDNIDLGKVAFSLARNDESHMILNNFRASRDKFDLLLTGTWVQENDKNITSVEGSLMIKDLEQETEKLGYTPTIKDSGLDSEFGFNWQASPYEFSVAQLNGYFNAKLDDGYLAEVPDQARVFSVLSLQSLVRKLSFDFRDIFADGMFYSSITGDFQLKDGIMYTDNMFMKGAAGDLEVKGNTDLGEEKLDIRMSYKPNVTSSLPALAWIATLNPVAFLAGVALEEVITSKVYYEMNFELTGTMSDPVFKDVNRKTRNISVGKTTPPKVIEDVVTPPLNNIKPNTPNQFIVLPKKSQIDG